ncbi:unknown [Sutterella sp. CAG:351]|nr:unknown [Sutterella sp. CAG:351]
MVTDAQRLQIFVAVQLFVVGIGDLSELCFILRRQNRYGVTPEIRACHRDDMGGGARHQITHNAAQNVAFLCRGMVKFVDCDQRLVKLPSTSGSVISKPKGCMSADEGSRRRIFEEFDHAVYLTLVSWSAEVVARIDLPIGKETMRGKVCILKGTANRHLGHGNNDFFQSLLEQLIERDEHESTGLTRSRRGFDKKILRIPLFISTGLHLTHAHVIWSRAFAGLGITNGKNICHLVHSSLKREESSSWETSFS